MYSIPTTVLKKRHLNKTRRWRTHIKNEGQKPGQSDGKNFSCHTKTHTKNEY